MIFAKTILNCRYLLNNKSEHKKCKKIISHYASFYWIYSLWKEWFERLINLYFLLLKLFCFSSPPRILKPEWSSTISEVDSSKTHRPSLMALDSTAICFECIGQRDMKKQCPGSWIMWVRRTKGSGHSCSVPGLNGRSQVTEKGTELFIDGWRTYHWLQMPIVSL